MRQPRTGTVSLVDATLRFVEMVSGPSGSVDLTEGALLLAAHDDPSLDFGAERAKVDELANGCAEPTLDALRHHLFDTLGFNGDAADYYDPQNSFLPSVIERRRGLPITLSLLTIEVGARLGIELDGIGMPGHFLVGVRAERGEYLDPFAGGAVLGVAECEQRFRQLAGPKAPFHSQYLAPIEPKLLLARMAANLVNAHRRADNRRGLRWAARLRVRCPGVSAQEQVQLAQALVHSGAYDEAAALYLDAAERLPAERERWTQEADRQLARLN